MGRKQKNPAQLEREQGLRYFDHYLNYLCSIAYQLFEWKNLPESVDPRYMELSLHNFGFVGFYKHPDIGYIASQGAFGGKLDHYSNPKTFDMVSPSNDLLTRRKFSVYSYGDTLEEAKKSEDYGVIIYNNDYRVSTLPSLRMFAADLAELKEVIRVNQNAQKTPVLITANDLNKLSLLNIYEQYAGNTPVIVHNETLDPNSIKVMKTDAPYVVDKLNTQKNAVWNEVMTFLGIKNANMEKRERMITAEADSNNEQITASGNVLLKSRQEAAKKINELYGLNIEVEYRVDVQAELQAQITPIPSYERNDFNG